MPRLVVHEEGQPRAVPLKAGEHLIGRSETCAIRLGAPGVSRHHCRIARGREGWEVEDLGSQNGTKVNGRRVTRRLLKPGDRIEMGGAVAVFDEGEGVAVAPPGLDATLSFARSIYGDASASPEDLRREREQLLRLSDVMLALGREEDLPALLDRVMGAAVALSGAERGFLILREGEALEVKAAANLQREALEGSQFALSRSVVHKVVKTGQSVCVGDAATERDFADARSVVDLGLRSILAVPLAAQREVVGALYLDHSARAGAFGPAEERLLRLFGSQAAVAIERERLREADRVRERLAHEVEVASRIQRRLLPTAAPKVHGLAVHGLTVPATAVTGDYFDYLVTPAGTCDVVVADVAGKGLPAGLVMVMVRAALRSLAPKSAGPRELLAEVHRSLRPDLDARLFVAMTCARWDEKRRELRVAGAGLGPALCYRAAKRTVDEVATGGIVVGAPKPDIGALLAEQVVPLAAGDTLLLFSDGATEGRDADGAEFGKARLTQALAAHGAKPPEACVAALLAAIQAHAGDADPHDDITLVALRRT